MTVDGERDTGSRLDPRTEGNALDEAEWDVGEQSDSISRACGAMTRSGHTCKQRAGWGIPGASSGPCRFHVDEGQAWETFDYVEEVSNQESVQESRAAWTNKAVLALTALTVIIGLASYYWPRPTRKTDVRVWNSVTYDPEAELGRQTFDGGEFEMYCQSPSLVSARPEFASCMLRTGQMAWVSDPCLRIRDPADGLKGRFVCGHPENSDKTANIYESVDLEPDSIPIDLGLPIGVPWMIKVGDRYCSLAPVADEEPWRNRYACPAMTPFIPADPKIWTTAGGVVSAMEAGAVPRYTFNGSPRPSVPGGEPDKEIAAVAGVVVDVTEVNPGVFEGRFSADGIDFEHVFIQEVWY